jgi:hypothetical protein
VRSYFAALLALVALTVFFGARRPTAPRRVAIRVACDLRGACKQAEALALDVWSEERGPDLPLDVVVPEAALARLAAAGVHYTVLVPDIDAVARAEAARLRAPHAANADFFAEYHDYRAIAQHLFELAAMAPARAAVQPIGSSLDSRTIWALRIGGGPHATRMLVDATLHAREWIAAAATTCVADRLVRDYDTDPKIRAFVDSTELWIVPVANPDGYQYTWSTDRYWRKNRRGRFGVDLNRNFALAWGGDGSSANRRSEVYRGEAPFSEPASAALRDLAMRERVALHVDFHAYGQLLLYPWDYTAAPAPDRARYAAIGDRMASAMVAAHGTPYKLIQGVELYPSSGTTSDWMYGVVHAMSYGIELRPRGGKGFVLPPEEIRPTCDEALAAVLALRAAY